MSQQSPNSSSARKAQFVASVKIAIRDFDSGRSPTECLRDIKRAIGVMEKAVKPKGGG